LWVQANSFKNDKKRIVRTRGERFVLTAPYLLPLACQVNIEGKGWFRKQETLSCKLDCLTILLLSFNFGQGGQLEMLFEIFQYIVICYIFIQINWLFFHDICRAGLSLNSWVYFELYHSIILFDSLKSATHSYGWAEKRMFKIV